jgi:hypothetical protein
MEWMKSVGLWLANRLQGRPSTSRLYRVRRIPGGFEPQMSYNAGVSPGYFWYALDKNGYWLDPNAYDHGTSSMVYPMSKDDAIRATLRARAINADGHIRAIPPKQNGE